MDIPEHDVIVVGAGNAATCAALSAKENGASVLQVEISPEAARGGNSAFTGGASPTSASTSSRMSMSAPTPPNSITTIWVG
jgi:succinate dehydrogenase/fumarate reductase flavoprotein subunit